MSCYIPTNKNMDYRMFHVNTYSGFGDIRLLSFYFKVKECTNF